jgi:hypothetical protein
LAFTLRLKLCFCVELSGLFILPVLVYMAPFLCKVVCGVLAVLAVFKVVIPARSDSVRTDSRFRWQAADTRTAALT